MSTVYRVISVILIPTHSNNNNSKMNLTLGGMKLNTNRSSWADPGHAGRAECGGLIRNEKAEWVKGFYCILPDCSALEAKL